jgi:hypothetical protein
MHVRTVRRIELTEPQAHLATLSMHLVDCLDRIQMVDTRVKTNFVHDNDTRFFGLLIKFKHCGGNIAGCDDMDLGLYCGLDDSRVVCIRDQRDDEIMCSDLSLEIAGVVDVKGNTLRIRNTICQCLCTVKRAACCGRDEDS